MKINTSSWHYWLYKLSYRAWQSRLPYSTNLCAYFWRVVFSLPIAFAGLMLWWAGRTILMLLFGFIPRINGDGELDVEEKHMSIAGHTVIPALLILPAGLIWLNVAGWTHHWNSLFIVEGILTVAVIITITISVGIISLSDSDSLIGQWIAAKKAKVCPLISFEDETKSEE